MMNSVCLDTGQGIIVRSWNMDDLDGLVKQADHPEVQQNLRDRFPNPYTRDDGMFFLNEIALKDPSHLYAVIVDGEVAGGIGVEHLEGDQDGVYELGYWLGKGFWGKGIMSAVLGAVIRYAFSEFKAQRIEASVFPWNPASRRVLEKHGFVHEGIRRKTILKAGKWTDMVLFGLLAEEYAGRNGDLS